MVAFQLLPQKMGMCISYTSEVNREREKNYRKVQNKKLIQTFMRKGKSYIGKFILVESNNHLKHLKMSESTGDVPPLWFR